MPAAPKKTPHFDLDTFEREGETPEPFVVQLNRKSYTLMDIQECDYRDIIKAQEYRAAGQGQRSIEIVVPEKDRAAFFGNKIPNFKLNALFDRYNKHHGITDPGEAPAS
jgi:hypothetical protein